MNTENLKSEIKKIKLKHVALLCAGIFLAFAIIGTILMAAGGGVYLDRAEGLRWGNLAVNIGPGRLYDVNDRAELDMEGVTAVEITTVSDRVTMLAGGEKAVAELKGQCRNVNGPIYMDARRNGGKVEIVVKYPRGSSNSSTSLTVTIPAGYRGDIRIKTVSGGIRAEDLPCELGRVSLDTTSGSIRLGASSFTRLNAGSVSGSIRVAGIAAETDIHTTAGKVELEYAAAAETRVVTVSGGVRASIPANAAFSVDFNSVTGGFRSNHPGLNVNKAGRGFTSITQGAPLIKVNTVSGGFRIEEK